MIANNRGATAGVLVLLAFLLMTASFAVAADAWPTKGRSSRSSVTYLGKRCWEWQVAGAEQGSGKLILDVVYLPSGYYLLTGFFTEEGEAGEEMFPAHGSAMSTDGAIHMGLTSHGSGDVPLDGGSLLRATGTMSMHAVLNATTSTGTFRGMEEVVDDQGAMTPGKEYIEGTLTSVSCEE